MVRARLRFFKGLGLALGKKTIQSGGLERYSLGIAALRERI